VESAEHADAIRGELAAALDRHEGIALGFDMDIDHETGPGALWIHADEYGEPEHVTRFVLPADTEVEHGSLGLRDHGGSPPWLRSGSSAIVPYANQLYSECRNGVAEARENPPSTRGVFRRGFGIGGGCAILPWLAGNCHSPGTYALRR
jgi:hypothetical protein